MGDSLKKILIWVVSLALSLAPVPAIAQERTESDQVDTSVGLQIKPIYLLPADVQDMQADLSGLISSILDEGNSFVEREIGKKFVIDRKEDGSYDIQFVRTKLTSTTLQSLEKTDTEELVVSSKLVNSKTKNRKFYVFFVPIETGEESVCGYANIPGISSVVLLGDGKKSQESECDGSSGGFSHWAAQTWVHEVFHNLGVDHTQEPCELMNIDDDCSDGQTVRIDPSRSLYVGADLYGPNILNLPVWEGSNSSQIAEPECQFIWQKKSKTFNLAICPIGLNVKIGPREFCWSGRVSFVLQQKVGTSWKSIGKGSRARFPWGTDDWECDKGWIGASTTIKKSKAGAVSYRWVTNGRAEKSFTVYWLN